MNNKSRTFSIRSIRPTAWILIIAVIAFIGVTIAILMPPQKTDAQKPSQSTQANQSAQTTPNTDSSKKATPRFTEAEIKQKYPDLSFIVGPGGPIKSKDDITNVHRRIEGDPLAIGKVDAPVVISDFSDFECPFCTKFANSTEKELKKYIDSGKVRFEWNDLPVNGPDAIVAAQAGRAAAAQGKFWEFHDVLYTADKGITGHPQNKLPKLIEFAKTAGVPDIDRFKSDIESSKYASTVTNARVYASSLGINGTPGFIVGTTIVPGAQPTEKFIAILEDELKKAGQ